MGVEVSTYYFIVIQLNVKVFLLDVVPFKHCRVGGWAVCIIDHDCVHVVEANFSAQLFIDVVVRFPWHHSVRYVFSDEGEKSSAPCVRVEVVCVSVLANSCVVADDRCWVPRDKFTLLYTAYVDFILHHVIAEDIQFTVYTICIPLENLGPNGFFSVLLSVSRYVRDIIVVFALFVCFAGVTQPSVVLADCFDFLPAVRDAPLVVVAVASVAYESV